MTLTRASGCIAVLAFSGVAVAQAPSIVSVGVFGGNRSSARAVSGDGSVVVGFSSTANSGFSAFRWTRAGGLVQLSGEFANSVSANGVTSVGTTSFRSAVRWVNTIGTDLGRLPGTTDAFAWGVSRDATSVVGHCNIPSISNHAYRWRAETGMVDLGFLPGGTSAIAKATNDYGNVIVGNANMPGANQEIRDRAFRWTEGGGMQELGLLPNTNESFATAVSGDGNVVTGYSVNTVTSRARPFRWTPAGGLEDLGTINDWTFLTMGAISANGLVLGGSRTPGFESGDRALMWTAATGLVDLNVYLPTLGLDLSRWVLSDVQGINADGTVLVGRGFVDGQPRGYVVVIPAPPAGALAVVILGAVARRRRRGSGDSPARQR